MTDNEIIRPDERIIANYENYIKDGCNNIEKELLDLAKRQKAEIKKLENIERIADKTISVQQAEIEALINGQKTLQKHIAEQKAEIDKYENIKTTINKFWDTLLRLKLAKRKEKPTLEELAETIGEIEADAIKEFAEKFKENNKNSWLMSVPCVEEKIDNLVKEMTE